MFGFKLISESELIQLRIDVFHLDAMLSDAKEYNEELKRENRVTSGQNRCFKEYVSILEEALEQQTREKKELQKQFDGYRALEFLNR